MHVKRFWSEIRAELKNGISFQCVASWGVRAPLLRAWNLADLFTLVTNPTSLMYVTASLNRTADSIVFRQFLEALRLLPMTTQFEKKESRLIGLENFEFIRRTVDVSDTTDVWLNMTQGVSDWHSWLPQLTLHVTASNRTETGKTTLWHFFIAFSPKRVSHLRASLL